jgi:hypothetical protein
MNKLASTLHDATHQVPGVPAHQENAPHEHSGAGSHKPKHQPGRARRHNAPERRQRPSRVLVAWQNWIGRHVERG